MVVKPKAKSAKEIHLAIREIPISKRNKRMAKKI